MSVQVSEQMGLFKNYCTLSFCLRLHEFLYQQKSISSHLCKNPQQGWHIFIDENNQDSNVNH